MKKPKIPVFRIEQHCAGHEVRDFKVAAFSETACTVAEFQENHRHDFFELIWLRQGEGVHEIDLRDHPYSGSVAFILGPGQIHRLRQTTKADGYVVKFKASVFDRETDFQNFILDTFLPETPDASPVLPVPADLAPRFSEIFARMAEEFRSGADDANPIIASYLRILLTHLYRQKRQRLGERLIARDPHYALFRDFRVALERHYRTVHTVSGYAAMLMTKARTLNEVTRAHGDRSAGDLIQDRLALEAQRLLFHGAGSIKEICYELGFADPAYFTRFFKKHTGVGPQAFRDRALRDRPGTPSGA